MSITVRHGGIVALVGANGAGKTTLLRAISGVQPISTGKIEFDGQDITALSAARRVRLGIVHVPEGREVFAPLSVEDNLRLGGYTRPRNQVQAGIEEVCELFPALREKQDALAGTLSGGEQQMLAIARALMGRPRLLILDEPSLGLAPLVVASIFEAVRHLNGCGLTVLLVEQNADLALDLAHDAYVLETGQIRASGSAQRLREDPAVQSAYLGAG